MQERLQTMLAMQDAMNRHVHPDWRERRFPWYRATWVECAELLDHVGYKWWKRQAPALDQVRLEIVDIWHFGLSALLQEEPDATVVAATIAATVAGHRPGSTDLRDATEALAQQALSSRRFSVSAFWDLLLAAQWDFDGLYGAYVGKNVLNVFRQDNGYQDGTYRKRWGDREDNEHLHELLGGLDSAAADFPDRLYAALGDRYAGAR